MSTEEGKADALLSQMETAAGVMSSAKLLIHWLDRNPSSLVEDYEMFRNDVMMSALDLVAILVRESSSNKIIHNYDELGYAFFKNIAYVFYLYSKTIMILLRC